jgi:hypothetical protein
MASARVEVRPPIEEERMSSDEERPKRSDQLPEEGPESVVPDDVPQDDPRSSEEELREQDGEA